MYKHHFGESGGMSEAEHFGVIDKSKYLEELKRKYENLQKDPAKKAEFQSYYEKLKQYLPPYEPRAASFDLIKRCQRFSPTQPDKEYARNFRREVLKQLSAARSQQLPEESILFYTACSDAEIKNHHLNTPLDQYHGIDAFLDINLGEGRQTRVTIDGSMDPNKMERRTKSDIVTIWPEGLDPRIDPDAFEEFVRQEARKVISHVATHDWARAA